MVMVEEDTTCHPWAGLDIQVHPNSVAMFSKKGVPSAESSRSVAMFSTSVISIVGDGYKTLFWCDK